MSSEKPASYLRVLKAPHAARTFLSALVARFAYGIVFMSLVLTVSGATGSYAVAGGVLAVFGLSSSLLAPYRARLIDRHGVRRALLPMAALCAAALGLIAAVAWDPGAPEAALWALAAAAGLTAPPLGPFMRTLWTVLVPEDDELQRAYALDTVAEELLYVVGPLLAGAMATAVEPALGVAVSAVLLFGGTAVLATSPPAVAFRSGPAPEGPDPVGDPGAGDGPGRNRSALWRGLLDPVLVTAGLGACLGAFNLLAVAFADDHGDPASVSWVSATMAISSALGGLLYGAVRWTRPLRARLPILAGLLGLFCLLAGQSGGMLALVAFAAGVGFAMSPTLTTSYLIAGEVDSGARSTEAGTWVNTAFNTGNAAGSAGIGLLLAPLSLAWCFAVTGAAVLVPALVVALRNSLRKEIQVEQEEKFEKADTVHSGEGREPRIRKGSENS
ncbi:MFS transporter [Streptomyces sp. NPDC097619]|uniref:MFS transporter n=1 Tax=Streptomyces sp. NPDC097619 TaxID=3157228 RepID=UPI003327C3E6